METAQDRARLRERIERRRAELIASGELDAEGNAVAVADPPDDDGTLPGGKVDGLEADGLGDGGLCDDVPPAAPPRRPPMVSTHPLLMPRDDGFFPTTVPDIRFRAEGPDCPVPVVTVVNFNAVNHDRAYCRRVAELLAQARGEREARYAAVRTAFQAEDAYAALVKLRGTRDGVQDRIAATTAKVGELEAVLPNVIRDGEDPFSAREALDTQRRELERLKQWSADLDGEISKQQKAAADELAHRLGTAYAAETAASSDRKREALRALLDALPAEAVAAYTAASSVFADMTGELAVIRRHGGI
jgi:hypothetical protein